MTSYDDHAKQLAEAYSDPTAGVSVDHLGAGEFKVDVETFSNQFHGGRPEEWEGALQAMIEELQTQRNR